MFPVNICLNFFISSSNLSACPQAPTGIIISAADRRVHPVEKTRKRKEIG
jgi:hypothetical protein